MSKRWLVAADIGGTGSRLLACTLDGADRYSGIGHRLQVGRVGTSALDVVVGMLRDLIAARPAVVDDGVEAFAAGVTGLVTLVDDIDQLHGAVIDLTGAKVSALAADFVTAHLGALRGAPGAVVAAGTGAVALGTDFKGVWRRVDGWGHLIGDLGGGAWIGMEALRAAAAALDGRADLGSPALARRAEKLFGPLTGWPALLYTSDERAGRMASFATEVGKLADSGDPVSAQLLERAGRLLAAALDAALGEDLPEDASFTGGLFNLGERLTRPFKEEFTRRRPAARLGAKPGSPLDGAMSLAARLAGPDPIHNHPPLLLTQRRRRRVLAGVASQQPSLAEQLANRLRLAASARPHPAFSAARLLAAWDGKIEVNLAVGVEQRFASAAGASLAPGYRRSVTTNTVFDLASITKVYVALALAELVHQSGESIDAPVGRFLDVAEPTGRVTLAQLLNHTSGLPATWSGWQAESGREQYWEDLLALVPESRPGARFAYSCPGYILAGAVAEKIAGVGLDRVVSQVLLEPMGLRRTAFNPPTDWPTAATEDSPDPSWAPRGMIRGQVHDEAAWALGGVAGNAGLFATGQDVLALAELIRADGVWGTERVISRRVVEMARTDRLTGPLRAAAGFGQGLGLRIADPTWMGPLAGDQAAGHTGFTGTAMMIDQVKGLTWVLLTNAVHPRRQWAKPNDLRLAVAHVLSQW
ncbi:MAG: serine hydrolase [Bifidobacteriaceae bacterium]|nr:serine hydrolase [Bifidobacteriaceae bacterium]